MITRFPPAEVASNDAIALDQKAVVTRPSDPRIDVVRGLKTGVSVIKKFGRNSAVGTSYVPITNGGIYRTPQSGAATALRIASGGDAQDDASGTGARSITLEGLDQSWNSVTEAVTTAGASASSATTATFTRLFRAYLTPSTGSGTYADASTGSHAAAITIEADATGGPTWASIDVTDFPKSQSEIGVYSVPTGYTAYVFLDDITIETNGKTCDLQFFWRANADETSAPYSAMRVQAEFIGLTPGKTDLSGKNVPFGPYVGPCDIGFMGKVDTGTGGISVEFEIYLVNE